MELDTIVINSSTEARIFEQIDIYMHDRIVEPKEQKSQDMFPPPKKKNIGYILRGQMGICPPAGRPSKPVTHLALGCNGTNKELLTES